MMGIELKGPKLSGNAAHLAERVLKDGLIVLPSGSTGDVISLTPPLTIQEDQLNWALSILKKHLGEMAHT